jgi:hypothetical protein
MSIYKDISVEHLSELFVSLGGPSEDGRTACETVLARSIHENIELEDEANVRIDSQQDPVDLCLVWFTIQIELMTEDSDRAQKVFEYVTALASHINDTCNLLRVDVVRVDICCVLFWSADRGVI